MMLKFLWFKYYLKEWYSGFKNIVLGVLRLVLLRSKYIFVGFGKNIDFICGIRWDFDVSFKIFGIRVCILCFFFRIFLWFIYWYN